MIQVRLIVLVECGDSDTVAVCEKRHGLLFHDWVALKGAADESLVARVLSLFSGLSGCGCSGVLILFGHVL